MTDPISPLGGKGAVVAKLPVGQKKQEGDGRSAAKVDSTASTAPRAAAAVSAVSPEELLRTAQTVEAHLQEVSTDLQFKVDQDTHIMTFKVVDSSTQKVIREYPPEEVLAMAKFIEDRLQSKTPGALVDLQH